MVSWQYKAFKGIVKFLPLWLKVQVLYFRRFRKWADLSSPTTFNEKLNWRKLNERDPLLSIAADKLASKEWVVSICPDVKAPETIWQGESFQDLPVESLPEKFVIKANHGSRMNLFFDKDTRPDIEQLEKTRKSWFRHDQFSTLGEWGYKNIKKQVFVEEFLDFGGTVPDDFKFFVYHGKVKFIQLDTGRFKQHYRNMFDENWQDLEVDYSHPRKQPSPEKPELFSQMKAAAERLGENFSFIRVDFYQLKGDVYFGELTVYPGAGYEVFPSVNMDVLFGKPWQIEKRDR